MTLKAKSALLLVAITSLTIPVAGADSVDATCEFYRHDNAKHDRWGACTFSQGQGFIDITLKNGATFNLRPRNDANQYRDQEGNKVDRTESSSTRQVFEWKNDQQKLVVTFK